VCCRYYSDRFSLLNKFSKYLTEGEAESLDKHAALQKKRVERTRKYSKKDDSIF